MTNNVLEKVEPPKPLAVLLDDFYACVDVCLHKVVGQATFHRMVDALTVELMREISARIAELKMKWTEELPMIDERHTHINWEELSAQASEQKEKVEKHRFFYSLSVSKGDIFTPADLVSQLESLANDLLSLDAALHPTDKPDLYIKYSQRYQQHYELNHWAKQQREWRNAMSNYATAHKKDFFRKNLRKSLDALKDCKPYVVSEDRTSMYEEALGVVLWRDASDEQTEALTILSHVRSAKYFADLLNEPIVMLDREMTEEERQIPEMQQKQDLQKVQQKGLPLIKDVCSCMSANFNKGYSVAWVNKFWDDALSGEQRDAFSKKMSTQKKRNKTICQVLGDLQDAGVFNGQTADIARSVKEKVDGRKNERKWNYKEQLPSEATLKDYARKGVDDVAAVHQWIVDYVAGHPVEA